MNSARAITRAAAIVRCGALLVCLATVLCQAQPRDPAAVEDPPLEYQVKAAFLLNFTKFIEWPASAFADPQSPFAICILGEDPFGRTLDNMLEGETVNSRKVVVRRLDGGVCERCQLLFIGRSEKNLPKTLAGLPSGVLTVGEGERFTRNGGMISFVIQNRRVRFDINQNAARYGALKISSKLLGVARSVE